MLQRKSGARLADLVSATGWLPRTTRAALTGLRKRGYVLERLRPEEGKSSVYSVVQGPAQSKAALGMRKVAIRPTDAPSADGLEADLAGIRALSLDELRARWREMSRQNAPNVLSRDLLARMKQVHRLDQRDSRLWRIVERRPALHPRATSLRA
jgi:hypothetical protein